MDSSKNGRWIIKFKKLGELRAKIGPHSPLQELCIFSLLMEKNHLYQKKSLGSDIVDFLKHGSSN